MGTAGGRSGRGRNPDDHVCVVYDDREQFVLAAQAFLAAGLRRNERTTYIGDAPPASLRPDLAALGDVDDLLSTGRLAVVSLADMYAPGTVGAPADQVQAYTEAVGAALAAGFTGMRVAADATALVVVDGDRDAFVRYEHLIDRRLAAGLRFSAMCGYDAARLGPSAAEVACLHPQVQGAGGPFRVYAAPDAAIALAGEVDAMCAPSFGQAIERILSLSSDRAVTVDCADLGFIDHRGLLALDERATAAGVAVELVDAPGVVHRLAPLLPLSSVRLGRRS